MKRIVIASRNRGKIAEIREILSLGDVELLDLDSAGFHERIEENGRTFMENAVIKARAVFTRVGLPVVADDSGIAVEALGGRPGVKSARFAGPGATDEENNALLLELLKGVPESARGASFICSAVLCFGRGEWLRAEGRVDGFVAGAPAGENGFGYDPLFILPSFGKTMAELPPAVKNAVSHRAKAFGELGRLMRLEEPPVFPRFRR